MLVRLPLALHDAVGDEFLEKIEDALELRGEGVGEGAAYLLLNYARVTHTAKAVPPTSLDPGTQRIPRWRRSAREATWWHLVQPDHLKVVHCPLLAHDLHSGGRGG